MSSAMKLPRVLFRGFAALKSGARAAKKQRGTERGGGDWEFALRRAAFNLSGYNKYGLYSDDVFHDDNPVVREALRRLPKDIVSARNFRIIRALQLDYQRVYLPPEEWVTFEQDTAYRYLQPYMREIEAERAEIREFGCDNYTDHDWPSEP